MTFAGFGGGLLACGSYQGKALFSMEIISIDMGGLNLQVPDDTVQSHACSIGFLVDLLIGRS